ncbi:MAG: S41 family peptidase [Oscillospiraceae bacterium]|nr:S41 family peptidase [Oscillospiraceae bacterium]
MMKQIHLLTSVGITALLCAVTFTGTVFFMRYHDGKLLEKYQRLADLDSYVQKNYYTEYDNDELINTMLKGYVSGLGDKYSQYMTPEEYSALKTREAGKTVGIGVTVMQDEKGYPLIIEVQENSPAESAGLKPEDVILAIEGEDILTMDYEEAINRIRGEENTKVTLTVRHDGEEKEFSIIRKSFDVTTAGGEMLDGHIGYIYITNFRENTADQFLTVLNDLISQGADALIFDVRNDGGGLLSALEKMLDPLLPEGEIATATYHGDKTETVLKSDAKELNLPIAILVNGNTASAAELFSASLRDFKQAKLVGTQTFGKGIMQVTTPMKDGGGLTLTVATYQTTKSECYHGIGLTPDIVIEPDENSETDVQLEAAKKLFE